MAALHAPILAAAGPPPACPGERSEVLGAGPWAVLLMLILAGAAYVDTLGYQFVWDDWAMIAQNRHIRTPHSVPELLDSDFTALTAGAVSGGYYRPVLALSLALDAALWGAGPAFFHLTNVLLHVLATYLLYRLVRALTAQPGLAVMAGLFFALHPVHVEAVAFVAARGDILLTLGVLGCVLAYRRWALAGPRRGLFLLAALGSGALALLAKESAIVLPAVLVLSDVAEHRILKGEAGVSVWRTALKRSLPFIALTVTSMVSRLSTLTTIGGDKLGLADLWARLPGSLEILARYAWLSLVPLHMQPYYSLTRPTSLLASGPVLGIATGAVLVSLLIWCRHRLPLGAFGLGWFLVAVAPVVDLVPLSFREMGLTDRYLYLPSVGITIFLAAVSGALLTSSASSDRRAGRTQAQSISCDPGPRPVGCAGEAPIVAHRQVNRNPAKRLRHDYSRTNLAALASCSAEPESWIALRERFSMA